MSEEVETLLQNISNDRGVLGVVVADATGMPIYDTFGENERSKAVTLAINAAQLVRASATIVKNGGEEEKDLTSLRIRTGLYEMVVMTGPSYIVVVVQDPKAETHE